jgi:uncharacterized membrane protein YjjP (DUF1212 family)
VTAEPAADPPAAFVLRLGRALHSHGYPAHRLEDALARISHRLGLEGQFFSTPTALFATFGGFGSARTALLRVEPGSVNLQKLAKLERLADEVGGGRLAPDLGEREIEAIESAPPPYGAGLRVLAFALASGAGARFLGGGAAEVLLSAFVGLVTGLLAEVGGRWGVGRVFEATAATAAAALATLVAHILPVSVYVATLGGLLVLVPGFSLTVSLTELGTRNLVSGTARLMGTAATFLVIGFGVALGSTAVERLLGPTPLASPIPLPGWTLGAALLGAPLCFTVLLRAEPRDAIVIEASGILAFQAARLGGILLGAELGAFLGALAVGILGNLYSRYASRPAAIPIVPGLLLLVPGSLGFQSLSWLIDHMTVAGVEAATRMALVAVALATGLLFSNVVVPPRGDAA